MPLVQKGLTPLDQLGVDLFYDVGPQRLVAPTRQGQLSSQCGHILADRCRHSFLDGRRGQGTQALSQRFDLLLIWLASHQRIERFVRGRG